MSVSQESVIKAEGIIKYMAARGDFMAPGRRNDHAVDFCIACHVLHKDPIEEFRNIADKRGIDRTIPEDHINRIIPYLDVWGSDGDEDDAFAYLIDDWD